MPPATDAQLLARWSQNHAGVVPSALVRGWLRGVWTVARPLARAGTPPDLVTLGGPVVAITAAVAARRRPRTAAGLVLLSTACDALDGAVALLADRASERGARLDRFADRVSDTALATVLARRGAPPGLVALAAASSLTHELGRADSPRAAIITVAERPSRVVCVELALLAAARTGRSWPATCSAAVWVGLHVVARAQFRRALATPRAAQ